jgi:hypothetical protein
MNNVLREKCSKYNAFLRRRTRNFFPIDHVRCALYKGFARKYFINCVIPDNNNRTFLKPVDTFLCNKTHKQRGCRLFKRNIVAKWLRGVLGRQQLFPQSDSQRNLAANSSPPQEDAPLATVTHLPTATTGWRLVHCCRHWRHPQWHSFHPRRQGF